jgi:hypothetical protein
MAGALSVYESDAQFGALMSLIHEMLVVAKSDEKIRTMVSLLQALCRSDSGGDVTTSSSSGTGSPVTSRTSGYASHAIRHKSRFGGYIRGLEIKVQSCVDQGDEDETRECGLTVRSQTHYMTNEIVFGDIRFEEPQ